MGDYFHSVVLEEDLCMGCTNCIKKCPTDAIRVQGGKARIMKERCIDCGECVRNCPYKAKVAMTDPLEKMADFRYTIALPAPTLYLQYDISKFGRDKILTALKMIGFDYVYEVARGAEIVTKASNMYLRNHDEPRPMISSACPAIVRLIQVRFPNLLSQIMPVKSPMEVAALNARREFCERNPEASPEDIGVFFISPCAAKMTSVKNPIEVENSGVDGVFSIKSVFFKLLKQMGKIKNAENILQAGFGGVRWATIGGEAKGIESDNILYVDGIQNVIRIFEQLEDDKLKDVDFIEAAACPGGCLGGPLTVENMYVAKTRNFRLKFVLPKMLNEVTETELDKTAFDRYPEHIDVSTLDSDLSVALQKLNKMDELCSMLPALDCGACGAPSCRALSEDIVRGKAKLTDCVFVLKEKVRNLAKEMIELENMLPPTLDNKSSGKAKGDF
ncbi:MAG: 4Fe-4S binding protein [Clostridia bacterium]|nr:4Fe-4S binding protein [Clostridia bacterium]